MRRSYKTEWLTDDNNNLIGVLLNASACAEHEWGIDRLKSILGIADTNPEGIESRKVNNVNKINYNFKKTATRSTLVIGDEYEISYISRGQKNIPGDLKSYEKKLTGAWDRNSVGIMAYSKEDKSNLELIYNALKNNDLSIWISSGIEFRQHGLVLSIISKVPQDKKDHMIKCDEENAK
jgi:hypothetical protein